MAEGTVSTDRIDTRADLEAGNSPDEALWDFWQGQERIAEKVDDKWTKRSRKIVERYRDERGSGDVGVGRAHRFNILWSNVQTLIPALYARTPKADVQRRFMDMDDTGRLASMILERALSYSLDQFEFDSVMRSAVQDKLLPGRGVARVMYVPHYGGEIEPEEPGEAAGEETTEPGGPSMEGDREGNAEFNASEDGAAVVDNKGDTKRDMAREVVYEECVPIYVYWEDYREGPARVWKEVPWVRYRAYMTRDALVERFGAKKGKKVSLDWPKTGNDQSSSKDDPPDIYRKAVVHEVWDKQKKEVVWLAPGTPGVILDKVADPLGLQEFFPSPDPLLATTTTDQRVPVPDFLEYQDQAQELDKLTARIDLLTQALKVAGVYPGSDKQVLQQLVGPGTENKLIAVEDWMAFADKGGLKEMIQYLPIQQIAATLIQLYDARDRTKQILYEITGIGDIMRGATNPTETLGAQELKANFSNRRITPQQREVARFARDIIRLMGGVIAGQFEASTLSQITGFPQLLPVPELPPPPMQWVPAPQQAAPMGGNVVPMPGRMVA